MDTKIRYRLKLFVAGDSARTERTVANLRRLCEDECRGEYDLLVVDILAHPEIAEAEKILATPTLVKEAPAPLCRVLGDLADREKVLVALGLPPR